MTAFGVNTSAGALNFGAAVEGPTNTFTYTSQALTVNAGSYTLRENDIAGYAEGTWSCTGATANPTSISAGAVVVPNGGTVVCTITNDDQPGSLQIVKRVVNDNGGTATVTAFGVNTSAGALNFGAAVEGPTTTFTYTSQALTVNAGSYTLREYDIAGYAEGTWSCTGATANPTSISAGAVVVPNGGTVVCTITNDDQAGSLQIVKRVVNDNGGTATVTAFGVNTSAGALNFGAAVEGPTNTFTYTSQALTVNAGSYTLRENQHRRLRRRHLVLHRRHGEPHLDTALARSSCPTAAPSSAPSPTTTSRAACRSSRGSSTTMAAPPPLRTSESPPPPAR